MRDKFNRLSPSLKIYFAILAISALGIGLGGGVLSNYFKEVYNVTAYQRGLIEFPRELPGVLTLIFIAGLSSFSDVKISIIAQLISIFGILLLGVFTPTFSVMLIFIFINSVGMHMSMPLRDSIGIDLASGINLGKTMGQYKGVFTGFTMLSGLIVFIGFKSGVFSFNTKIKWIFIVSALILSLVVVLYVLLEKKLDHKIKSNKKFAIIYRREYKYYYVLTVMFGVQKQIMLVYGPWVLISLLNKKIETIAILGIVGAFIGIFFMPALGRWIDKFGIKKLLYADAISFIVVYLIYGVLAAGFVTNKIALVGIPVFIAYVIVIVDKMSSQMGIIRILYLKSILVDEGDLRPTLSLGLSLDHIVSIICAYLGGIVWIKFGPQYIFFLAATLSLVNLYVAKKVKA